MHFLKLILDIKYKILMSLLLNMYLLTRLIFKCKQMYDDVQVNVFVQFFSSRFFPSIAACVRVTHKE